MHSTQIMPMVKLSQRSMTSLHDIALTGGGKAYSGREFSREEDRQRVVPSLRDLLARYEKPSETLWEMAVGQPALNAAVKICLDLGLFES